MRSSKIESITLALTGASGMPYAFRLLDALVRSGKEIHFLISKAGRLVVADETDHQLPGAPDVLAEYLSEKFKAKSGQIRAYAQQDWYAPMASGSGMTDAMVVCPCTSGSLAAFAMGTSDNLIERAVDVAIKERKELIIVPREMPFSSIHLENLLKLSRAGATIMPPNPGFYQHPESIADLVDFVVARILDHLGIEQSLLPRWGHKALKPD